MSSISRNAGKTKKSKSRGVVIVLLLLIVFFALGFLGYKTLRVAHIDIDGNEFISDDQIIALCGFDYGEHLLNLDLSEIKKAVSKQPYLDVLAVVRNYPDTVVISVRERKKEAVLQYMEQAIFIDRTGRVLEIRSGVNIGDMLVVKGMSISGFSEGEPISVHDEYQKAVLVKVLGALYDSKQDGWYTAVDMTNPVDVRLESRNNIRVDIGQASDLINQLETAGKALVACKSREISGGVLDVTNSYTAAYTPVATETVPDPELDQLQPDNAVTAAGSALNTENTEESGG